jgi:signal transduction histidine kinase
MDGMKSLLNINLRQFLVYAFIIALCCAPLLFYVTKHFYTEDLDELTIYRSEEFKIVHLSSFTVSDINAWNYFNEDLQILEKDNSYPLNKPIEKNLYNKAEGHNIDYRIYYTLIEIEGTPYIFMSRIPMIENKDLILGLIGQYGILIIILLVSLSLMQQFISRKLWSPFYSTLQQIKSFNLEKGNIPVFEKTDIKEFSQLNDILEVLIKDNLKTYTQQREFIENASHELQTPLSIFQSQLDILLQQPELTEKQVEIMQSLYSVSSRMTRLNKNLLLLAKIDNNANQ